MIDRILLVMELMKTSGASCKEALISKTITNHLLDLGVPAESITSDDAHKKSMYGGETGNLIVDLPGPTGIDSCGITPHLALSPAYVHHSYAN